MNALRRIVPVLLIVAAAAVGWFESSRDRHEGAPTPTAAEQLGIETAASAFEAKRSQVWVEDSGTVVALLPDDLEGSRHQRFLVRLGNGGTILVAHNIDLAPRVPIEVGDDVSIRGEYIWNEKGGLVHWTHHDPDDRKPGGWIKHEDSVFE